MYRRFSECIPDVLSYLFSSLWKFFLKLLGIILIWGTVGLACPLLSLELPRFLLNHTQITPEAALLLKKILLTITPIIPTFFYAIGCVESVDEENDGFSIELCFLVWVFIGIYAWVIL